MDVMFWNKVIELIEFLWFTNKTTAPYTILPPGGQHSLYPHLLCAQFPVESCCRVYQEFQSFDNTEGKLQTQDIWQ